MPPLPQNIRNALNKAAYVRRAIAHGGGHVYCCFLDEMDVEEAANANPNEGAGYAERGKLSVCSGFRFQSEATPPREILRRLLPLDALLPGHPIAWVEDSGTELWFPFWARGAWITVLEALRPGAPLPSGLSDRMRRTLVMAGIAVLAGAEQARRDEWREICIAARAEYRMRGYVILRGLLPAVQRKAMRCYYRALVAAGTLPLGDSQVPERYRLHSERLASYFHPQLASLVGRIVDEPVKPSYAYFASYRSGAALPKHVDRPQCEFSVSLLTDFVPESDGQCGWPLMLEDPTRSGPAAAADLAVGDGVLYQGRELVHFRDPLPQGRQSSSVFFHYVRPDFTGDLC